MLHHRECYVRSFVRSFFLPGLMSTFLLVWYRRDGRHFFRPEVVLYIYIQFVFRSLQFATLVAKVKETGLGDTNSDRFNPNFGPELLFCVRLTSACPLGRCRVCW